MKNIVTRTITGVCFVALLIGCILWGKQAFAVLFTVLTALSLAEFYGLVDNAGGHPAFRHLPHIAGGAYLFAAFYYYCSGEAAPIVRFLFVPYILYLLYTFAAQLYARQPDPIRNWAYALLGQLYIALPFALLNFIAFPGLYTIYMPSLLLAFFVFIWTNDTGAFLVGVTLGRHRLFERVSPKKSWEGFFGGLFFCGIVAGLLAIVEPALSWLQWVGLGVTVSVSATFGDLCESLLKRTVGVKDSGSSLPGHGGWLDRFDSVLFAAPAAYVYLQLFG
ncbi:MAG: phosphatidate cytidylyltransferase [Coprobacter sp.]|nr:phosphatidate cytidylyltransferase [Coprobacter sp.]